MTSTAFRLIVAAVLAAAAPRLTAQAPQPPVETLYADAVAKEVAVQKALGDADASDTVLKAVRTVVSDFEALARRFPSSGYADDALWRAGRVSIDGYEKFHEPRDRASALRLLRALVAQYPGSKLARQAGTQIADLEAAAPRTGDDAEADASSTSAPAVGQAAPPLATIKGVRRTVLPDAVRVIVELDREVPFHDEQLEHPSRVFVDLLSTRANPSLIDQTIRFESDADLVRQVRIGRHPNKVTRVVLDTNGVSSYSVYPLYSPYRLVIDCLRAPAAAAVDGDATTARVALPTGGSAKPAVAATTAGTAVARPAPPRTVALLRRRLGSDWTGQAPLASPVGAVLIAAAQAPDPPAVPPALAATATPAASSPMPVAAGAASRNLSGGFSIARQLGLGVSRIVIDPGHGGHDPGAKGAGATEAALVLDIALRLEKLLEKVPGVEVVLTRRTDEFVSLQERTAIANRESADLFLSIHANASNVAQARGIETYFLNFATNLSAAAVAARENAGSGQSMAALPDVVKTIALNNKVAESRDFATYVQRTMIQKLRASNRTLKDLGVKQAPFVVLVGAAMPSVLAEVSFITNPQEARLLKGNAYRQRIAEALFEAVRKYQASLTDVSTLAQQ
jgi:N-acetylmuramoyl-L-alanine amidase